MRGTRSAARRARLVENIVVVVALVLAAVSVGSALIAPHAAAIVISLSGAAIAMLLAVLLLLPRSNARLSGGALESALAEALRAIAAIEGRTDRVEKSVASSRAIARSGDEVPAWIELARRVPLGRAVFERSVDPRAVLALLDGAAGLPSGSPVVLLADDAIGAVAARALLQARSDLRPVIITSMAAAAAELTTEVADDLRIEVRSGTAAVRSFGGIAGPWYARDDLVGLEGTSLVLVAGPAHSFGAAARHAVVAGLLELTTHVVLVVSRPADGPVARAIALWKGTATPATTITSRSPWELEVSSGAEM
ncbi:MAG: hypothetical protein RLZZ608_1581 [Actinomycetota bacterium]